VEAGRLTVEADGIKVTVEAADSTDLWAALSAVIPRPVEFSSFPLRGKEEENSSARTEAKNPVAKTKVERLRQVAKKVLADGRVHERREISKAAREAGLDPQPLTKALEGHFERGMNVDGRPTYRDPSVASPYVDPRADEKPGWLPATGPAHEDGDLEVIEAARNGGGDGR
jgi:hypothetical protein